MARPEPVTTGARPLERIRSWPRTHRPEALAAAGGAAIAALLIGPGLGRGALINLDQVILPRVSMPSSIFGTGPQLPRRAPFTAIVAAFGPLGMSDIAAKLLILVLFGLAAAGMARLCRRRGDAIATGVGVLYVASPFLLTRVVVGHLGMVWAAALLPWLLPELCARRPRLRRVLWMSVGIALGGYLAGSALLLVGAAVLIARFGRVGWSLFWRIAVAQAVWFVPGAAIAAAANFNQPSGADFATRLAWPSALFRLLGGDGFFHPEAYASAPAGVLGVVVGGAVALLAGAGVVARLRAASTGRARNVGLRVGVLLAVAGVGLSLASILPGVRSIWPELTSGLPLNLFREGQRTFLVAWLVICPAVAWGLAAIARRWAWSGPLTGTMPVALALVMVGPSAWGAEGQLEPVQLPSAWEQARAEIRRDPGPTLLLPIVQYFGEPAANGRRSHQLFPYYAGGDVIFSSDDGSNQDDATDESWQQDPRMTAMLHAVTNWGFGREQLAPDIVAVGAKYVVILNAPGAHLYVPLFDEPGLHALIESPSLVLLKVEGFGADGHAPRPTLSPWPGVLVPDSSDTTSFGGHDMPWAGAAGKGWMSGFAPLRVNERGVAVVSSDAGWIWYWPAALTQAVWLTLAVIGGLQLRSARRRARTNADTTGSGAPAPDAESGTFADAVPRMRGTV